ncbi:MAG: hypothetical protein HGA96_15730 [Desulfobulbaceae bacterium]|nr:hypothetical protein [Desulfobulbaceae bacterium]
MWKISKVLGVVISFLLLLTGGAGAAGMPLDTMPLREMEGHYYFLGNNLHADQGNGKVSSVNYQLAGDLLPWGTEVRIVRVARKYLVFEDVAKRRQYRYGFYWKTRSVVPLVDHVKRVFLDNVTDLRTQVEGLSELDKDGIYEGRVRPGMSREAVLVAIGYPPEFANREALMSDRQWLYWINRFERMVISFSRDGLVNGISGNY